MDHILLCCLEDAVDNLLDPFFKMLDEGLNYKTYRINLNHLKNKKIVFYYYLLKSYRNRIRHTPEGQDPPGSEQSPPHSSPFSTISLYFSSWSLHLVSSSGRRKVSKGCPKTCQIKNYSQYFFSFLIVCWIPLNKRQWKTYCFLF